LDARVALAGSLDAPIASWSIAGADLTDGTAPPIALDAKGAADATHVAIDALVAGVAGGRVTVSDGSVALTPEQATRLHATFAGIDVGTLLDAYAPQVPIAGRLDGELDAAGAGLAWMNWRTSARARVRGVATPGRDEVPLDGLVTAASGDGQWR